MVIDRHPTDPDSVDPAPIETALIEPAPIETAPIDPADIGGAVPSGIRIEPMRRRHLRGVLRIEQQSNPHPWSLNLFISELGMPESRIYVVARDGARIVGYAGAMLVVGDAHITNVGVAPEMRRQGIATRLLLAVARRAVDEGQTALTLEVRASNTGAQALYRAFGFAPAGVRKRYYSDNAEDALVMWADDIDTVAYRARLLQIERDLDRTTPAPHAPEES